MTTGVVRRYSRNTLNGYSARPRKPLRRISDGRFVAAVSLLGDFRRVPARAPAVPARRVQTGAVAAAGYRSTCLWEYLAGTETVGRARFGRRHRPALSRRSRWLSLPRCVRKCAYSCLPRGDGRRATGSAVVMHVTPWSAAGTQSVATSSAATGGSAGTGLTTVVRAVVVPVVS
jgi:hypothetical protein